MVGPLPRPRWPVLGPLVAILDLAGGKQVSTVPLGWYLYFKIGISTMFHWTSIHSGDTFPQLLCCHFSVLEFSHKIFNSIGKFNFLEQLLLNLLVPERSFQNLFLIKGVLGSKNLFSESWSKCPINKDWALFQTPSAILGPPGGHFGFLRFS